MPDKGLIMKYFVLKPGGLSKNAAASRWAILAYADAIADDNKKFAEDLYLWVEAEQKAAGESFQGNFARVTKEKKEKENENGKP
jgi:hypothetical protein